MQIWAVCTNQRWNSKKKNDVHKLTFFYVSYNHQQGTRLMKRNWFRLVMHSCSTQRSQNSIWKVEKQQMNGEKKKQNSKNSFPYFWSIKGSKIGFVGAESLSQALKTNTTLTHLNLTRLDKKNRHQLSHWYKKQQKTKLKTKEQHHWVNHWK